jgi:hypothetical protein
LSRNRRAARTGGEPRTRAVRSSRIALSRLFTARRRPRVLMTLVAGALALSGLGVAVAATISNTPGGQLIEFGPEDSSTGYPSWYRDAGFQDGDTYYDSLDLAPCIGESDPLCIAAPLPDPSKPADVKTGNMPDEFFYFSNTAAALQSNGANPVLFESNLEGAWSAEEVNDGDQVVFGRIRIRVEGLEAGKEYTVTHPQGVDTFTAAAGKRGINYTQDIAAAPKQFDSAFKSRVGPFLRWAPNPNDPNDRPPTGYIGDPAVNHRVIGSPHGTNYVRITGPQVGAPAGVGGANPNPCPTDPKAPGYWDGPAENCIYTDLFNLMGKESDKGGVDTNRATYSRAADGKTAFDVFSRSSGSQQMVVRDGNRGGDQRFATTPLVGRQGKYFAHVGVTGELPQTVTVANLSDDPDSVQQVPLQDLVTVTSAVFDTAEHTLTVQAHSSDQLRDGDGTPVTKLTLPDYGDAALVDGQATVDLDSVEPAMPRPVAPVTVRVKSSAGAVGVGQIVGHGPATAVVSAAAIGPATAQQGSRVTLSADGSLGTITSYRWTAPDGITLDHADTATPSFTVPQLDPVSSTKDLTFTLTVTGPEGSDTATVTVKVLPVIAPKAVIAPPDIAEPGRPFTLDGSRSAGAATYTWAYVRGAGDPSITLADTTSPRLQFTYPTDVPLDPNTGDPRPLTFRLTVTNARGESSTTTVAVSSATTDVLTPGTARYREDKRRWTMSGTAKLVANNQVTLHAGPTLDGPVIARATVASAGGAGTVGTWAIDVNDSPVTLGDAICDDPVKIYCVSIESSRGASVLGIAVDRPDRLTPPTQLPEDQQPTTPPATGGTAAAAAAPAPAAAAQPGVQAQAVPQARAATVGAARVAAPTTVAAASLATTGVPVTVAVPQGASVLRVRVLNANATGAPLFESFQKVKGSTKVKVNVKSAKLRKKVHTGKRYLLEVRAGTAKNKLGKATRKAFRVR